MQTCFVLPSFPFSRAFSRQSSHAICKDIPIHRPFGAKTFFYSPSRFPRNVPRNSTVAELKLRASISNDGPLHESAPILHDANPSVVTLNEATTEPEFNWLHNWYPVLFELDFPSDRPEPFQLFGQDYVLWKGASGTIHCLKDKCPHRWAPLSAGRIRGEDIACGYHGWQFDSAGKCVGVPHLQQGEAVPKAACVGSFPVLVKDGLVWMSPDNVNAPDASLIPRSRYLEKCSYYATTSDYVRDFPADWIRVLEGVADPAHIPFLHKGTIPADPGQTVGGRIIESCDRGYTAQFTLTPGGKHLVCKHEFHAPNLYIAEDGPDSWSPLMIYTTPLRPGLTRIFFRIAGDKTPFARLPRWLRHLSSSQAFDEDIGISAKIQSKVERETELSSVPKFFLTTRADSGTRALLRWLNAHPMPMRTQAHPTTFTNSVSRYRDHVVYCRACREALKNSRRLKVGSAVALTGWLVLLTRWSFFPTALQVGVAVLLSLTIALASRYERSCVGEER